MDTTQNENFNQIEKIEKNKAKKTNCQLFFNITIIILLIGILCFLFFQKPNKQKYAPKEAGTLSIAYVNSDSLMSQYLLFHDLKGKIETETIRLSNELKQKEQSLQNQFSNYQKKVETGNISYDDARKTEENLGQQQQSLMQLSEIYTNQIAEMEYNMSKQILDSITNMISNIKSEYDFDYVLGYTQGAGILYADSKHDITEIIVTQLNSNYKKNKSEK